MTLSVSDLTRLLDSGEYRRCLREAAIMLAEGIHDAVGEARIQAAVCRSYLELTDYHAAIAAGQKASVLADRAGAHDVLGAVLLDLGTAYSQVRNHTEALNCFQQYLGRLAAFTAAKCLEGAVRCREGASLLAMGRPEAALESYRRAASWYDRFGDEASVQECLHVMLTIHLELQQPDRALPLLREGRRLAARRSEDLAVRCRHLLDQTLYLLATGQYAEAAQVGFAALEMAEDRLQQQAEAQLLMCRAALAQGRFAEALSLALAARVTAIDGRLYEVEFEAAQVMFRLLAEKGLSLFREVEDDYHRQGVNVYHYLSEKVLRQEFPQ